MICFRDMTFCCSEVHTNDCTRQWTPELQAAADRWWQGCKGPAPVCFAPLCDAARALSTPSVSGEGGE